MSGGEGNVYRNKGTGLIGTGVYGILVIKPCFHLGPCIPTLQ